MVHMMNIILLIIQTYHWLDCKQSYDSMAMYTARDTSLTNNATLAWFTLKYVCICATKADHILHVCITS